MRIVTPNVQFSGLILGTNSIPESPHDHSIQRPGDVDWNLTVKMSNQCGSTVGVRETDGLSSGNRSRTDANPDASTTAGASSIV